MENQLSNKRSMIELIANIFIGLVIIGLLAATFIVLIIRFPPNNNIVSSQVQEQQETILKLLIKSNEHIAELQRKHEIELEQQRQIYIDKHREEDHRQKLSEQLLQQNITFEFLRRLEEIDEKNRELDRLHHLTMEYQQASTADRYRYEDQERQNEKDLDEFFLKYNLTNTPRAILEDKILNLIRRFNLEHKTSLIKILYRENLLRTDCNESKISTCRLDLHDANLSGIQFGIKYQDSCIIDNYKNLYLPRMNLINTSFDCLILNGVDLSSSNLTNSSFYRSRLQNMSLLFNDLTGCNFQDAKMDNVILLGSLTAYAKFHRATFVNTEFTSFDGNWSDFTAATLVKSKFLLANLVGAKFNDANISELDLSSSRLENASFYRTHSNGSDFGGSHLTNTSFREANLHRTIFLIAEGNQTDFSNSILDGSNFRMVRLNQAFFYNATMNNVSLSLASIINSNLRNASLIDVDFYYANLTGSDLSQAQLNRSTYLTDQQLDTVFSISNTILPNGTIGKNKNLIKYGHPICNNLTTTIMNTTEWTTSFPILIGNINNSCVFQSTVSNITTMIQIVDISNYVKRMISAGLTNILIEIDVILGKINANLRLFDSKHDLINQTKNIFNETMDKHLSVKHRIYDSKIIYAKLEILFLELNTTINNIHLSIEV